VLIADLCAGVAVYTRAAMPGEPVRESRYLPGRSAHSGSRAPGIPTAVANGDLGSRPRHPRNDGVDRALGASVIPGPTDRQDANVGQTADAQRVDWGELVGPPIGNLRAPHHRPV